MPQAEPAPIVVDAFAPERRTLRIAIVTETYPPEVNGVAATIACCVEGLRARQHHVQLVRPRQDGADIGGDVLLRGLPIPNYPHLKMGLPATRALVRLWTLSRPDLVHIVTEGPLGWSALRAARKLRLPVSSDFRTNFHAYGQHYGMGWLHRPLMAYLRKFHNRCDLTMVPTEALRQQLAGQGLERLRVVARGVDAALFHPGRRSDGLRAEWGARPDTPVVVHVGRIAPEKNLGVLMDAVQAMRAIDPRVRLVMVGDGPMRAELARQWQGRGVVFAGARTGHELAAHYASGDIFLFPSVTETFGNVTPEAMASGLAVLAYDYAAAHRLIRHGSNGLLAGLDDAADFVAQAEQMARRPELVSALRRHAREAAAALAWPQVVGEMESLFLGVLQADGHRVQGLALAAP
ncbi:glycosyltransferase family 1 protein [Pseudorhodoferax sp. Leaf267]|uniref:glycosyltransferase family 4 protein n=1 Tax=Pseudorhodoferax sp. Leaf267 TaxID=1736316 RepID=UPI0006F1F16A|nr:glycosyltransferase family 1 protein [Pseudorhodoferax sp. Leaf267]KQP17760.1 glycoside hydrolase [Pseudorhodoferax sp. Leaf267]